MNDRKLDVLVVENNVRSPDALNRNSNVIDSAEQFWVPTKQHVVPSLKCT